jgi:regulator of RNase E activity RraA
MITINPRQMIPVSKELLDRLAAIVPATLGHLRTFGFVDTAIRPLTGASVLRLLGRAVTVRGYGIDGAIVHVAIDVCEPGDVLVIDRGGDTHRACWGEMTSLAAKVKGVAGTIVDGAATDIAEILAMGYPVYCRGVSALTTSSARAELGDINVDVSCGGVTVHPGDVILADENGIVVIDPGAIESMLADAEPRQQREGWLRQQLLAGRPLCDLSGAREKIKANLGK